MTPDNMMGNRTINTMPYTDNEDLMDASESQLQIKLIDIDAEVARLRIKISSTSNIRDKAIFKDRIDVLLFKRQHIEELLSHKGNFQEDIEIQLIELDAEIEKLKVRVKNINEPNK